MTTPEQRDIQNYLYNEINHYHPGSDARLHPQTWDDSIMPLWEFGYEHVGRILDACDRERPPQRWAGEPGIFQAETRAWYEWHWTRGRILRPRPGYTVRARRHISRTVRLSVYDRDGWACLHCASTDDLSLDHIHPYSMGGSDSPENLQTLCRSCNSRKGVRV